MAKDFSNNAAFEMLNTPASEGKKKATVKTATTRSDLVPNGTRLKATVKTATTAKTFEPTKKENKSKKLLLLLKPTLHERLKTKAASIDMSINELVNQILEQNV